MKVLHCPTLVGGNAPALAAAERVIGLDSRCVALLPSPWGYEADEVLCPPAPSARRLEAARLRLLARALRWADVVHFNFGQTTMPVTRLRAGRDLPLLRRAGKVVAITYQGDDARQRAHAQRRFDVDAEVGPGYYPPGSDGLKQLAIRRAGRHAHLVYALNPDLLELLPAGAEWLPYAHVGERPLAVRQNAIPVVGHAPTHRGIKGTRHVLAALDALRAEGLEFETDLIEDVPHARVAERLARCDLFVDQLLIGFYGGVAVEAMAAAVPVVCHVDGVGGHPLIEATPTTIRDVLREWLTTRRHELPARGAAAREWTARVHDPLAIARRLRADYEAAAG